MESAIAVWNQFVRIACNQAEITYTANHDYIRLRRLHTKPSAWIKNKNAYRAFLFFGGAGRNRTDVLLGCQKTFYILSLSIFLTSIMRVNTPYETQKAQYSFLNAFRFKRECSVFLTPWSRPTDKSGTTIR